MVEFIVSTLSSKLEHVFEGDKWRALCSAGGMVIMSGHCSIWVDCRDDRAVIHDGYSTYCDVYYADPRFFVLVLNKLREIFYPTPVYHESKV